VLLRLSSSLTGFLCCAQDSAKKDAMQAAKE